MMSNQHETELPRGDQKNKKIPFRQEKPSERPVLRVMENLRKSRLSRRIRDVSVSYEETPSKERS